MHWQSTSFVSNVQSCGPSDLPSVGIFFIQSSWRPFLQNQQIGLVAVSLHSMVISSKIQLRLQVRESGYLHPCGIQQIPCVNFPDVFSTLPGFQTHCYIGSTLACVDLPLIIPWLYLIYPVCHN